MFKLLIVDDHPHLVEGMAVIIDWAKLKIEQVFKAYSGYEAIEILEKNRIDIIITDIRMPLINGLELIKIAREKRPGIRSLLLTGYAEFEYAKEAIENGVSNYLLKPVRDEELIECVNKIVKKIEIEQEQIKNINNLNYTLNQSMPLLKDNLLNSILQEQHISKTELIQKLKIYALDFNTGDKFCIMIVNLEDDLKKFGDQNHILLEYAFCNIAYEIFDKYFSLWHCKDAHGYLTFLVKLDEEKVKEHNTKDNIKVILKDLAYQVQKNCKMYLETKVSMILSDWGIFPDDILDIYYSSLNILWKYSANDSEFILTANDEIEIFSSESLESLYETPSLIRLLEDSRWEEVEIKINKIFNELSMTSKSKELVHEAVMGISNAMCYITRRNGKDLSVIIGKDYYKLGDINSFKTVNEFKELILKVICRLKQEKMSSIDSEKKVINEVKKYIEANLSNDVSLNAIAEHIYVHPVYLSALFKKETGVNLSSYIYRIRMEQAIHLLKTTNEKIYEITEKLGYQSTQHFIRTFKKHTGITPVEFRNNEYKH